jgi:hypothetical protein
MNESTASTNDRANEAPPKIEPLHLSSTIDAAEIDRLDEALRAAFYERLLADRRRTFSRYKKFAKHRVTIVRWICFAGLFVAMLLAFGGGVPYRGYRLELLFSLFFICGYALSYFLPRYPNWESKPWPPFWRTLAKIHASGLLTAARKLAPFDAEYTFDGDSVMYFRTVAGNKKFAWQRPLRGQRMSGPGFTLLLKNEKSLRPTVIILHQPSADMDAWLDRMGCFPAKVAQS